MLTELTPLIMSTREYRLKWFFTELCDLLSGVINASGSVLSIWIVYDSSIHHCSYLDAICSQKIMTRANYVGFLLAFIDFSIKLCIRHPVIAKKLFTHVQAFLSEFFDIIAFHGFYLHAAYAIHTEIVRKNEEEVIVPHEVAALADMLPAAIAAVLSNKKTRYLLRNLFCRYKNNVPRGLVSTTFDVVFESMRGFAIGTWWMGNFESIIDKFAHTSTFLNPVGLTVRYTIGGLVAATQGVISSRNVLRSNRAKLFELHRIQIFQKITSAIFFAVLIGGSITREEPLHHWTQATLFLTLVCVIFLYAAFMAKASHARGRILFSTIPNNENLPPPDSGIGTNLPRETEIAANNGIDHSEKQGEEPEHIPTHMLDNKNSRNLSQFYTTLTTRKKKHLLTETKQGNFETAYKELTVKFLK